MSPLPTFNSVEFSFSVILFWVSSIGKILFAALDTFENEPKPEIKLLMHRDISLTPHIGAATNEAQDRIGEELANQINNLLK